MTRPDFVVSNVKGLHNTLKRRKMKLKDLSRRVGLSSRKLFKYLRGIIMPGKQNYNRLAVYFSWEVWR